MVDQDDWQFVKKKNATKLQKKGVNGKERLSIAVQLDRYDQEKDISFDESVNRIKYIISTLGETFYFQNIIKLYPDFKQNFQPTAIIALGIGSISQYINSMWQFALLVLLKERFEDVKVLSFDPVASKIDQDISLTFGVDVLKENLKGNYNLSEEDRIIYYMPHCPYRLYCNVIWNHWSNLSKIVIIGNSFESYLLRRMSGPDKEDETDSIRIICSYIEELTWCPNKLAIFSKKNASCLSNSKDKEHRQEIEGSFCELTFIKFPEMETLMEGLGKNMNLLKPSTEILEKVTKEDVEVL